jgi:hypothetical protein
MHVVTSYNYFFELQSFLGKDNISGKSTIAKENVTSCIIKVEKIYIQCYAK